MFQQRFQSVLFFDEFVEFEEELLPERRLRLLDIQEEYDAYGDTGSFRMSTEILEVILSVESACGMAT